MNNQKFYFCKNCGNLVGLIQQGGGTLVCCGEPMIELTANTTDASQEKHVPVITVQGDSVHVAVGSAEHPMAEEHFIQWIYLQTEHGGQRRCLKPGDQPAADFILKGDKAVAAYAYCNLHGLWKKEV